MVTSNSTIQGLMDAFSSILTTATTTTTGSTRSLRSGGGEATTARSTRGGSTAKNHPPKKLPINILAAGSGGDIQTKTKATTEPSSSSSSPQDLQDLNTLACHRCWLAIEQCASTVDSIHHTTFTKAGNAPLHSAISNGAPLTTVQALVIAHPPSVARGNHFGNTPLHFGAWKNKYSESFAIVSFLLVYHPQAARASNKHGNLPLHHATNYKAHPDIVQLLYRAYPPAIHMTNDQGKTPLDMAIHRFGEKHPVVALLKGDTGRNYVYKQQQHQPQHTPSSNAAFSATKSTSTKRKSNQDDSEKSGATPRAETRTTAEASSRYRYYSRNSETQRRLEEQEEGTAADNIQTDVWQEVDLS